MQHLRNIKVLFYIFLDEYNLCISIIISHICWQMKNPLFILYLKYLNTAFKLTYA